MQITEKLRGEMIQIPLSHGAHKANIIERDKIVLDRVFRDMCAANSCGVYGKCWMCPPDVGDIDELMASLARYDWVLVYQTVTNLEDSFDFEGMTEAKNKIRRLSQQIRREIDPLALPDVLHLSAGGCGLCPVCAKKTDEPCRFPDLAMSSLEAYGIHVSKMAEASGMNYINGANTVTYFGAVFFNAPEEKE